MPTSRTSISTITLPATPLESARPPSPTKGTSTVRDSGNFLTALAAQERRVLELREELQKAEEDLSRLKKQWATHETIKKKNEFRHREQLQQLKVTRRSSCDGDSHGTGERTSLDQRGRSFEEGAKDVDRTFEQIDGNRPAPQTSRRQRKVFPGSRHRRSLSLLSKLDTAKTPSEEDPHRAPLRTAPVPCESSLSPQRDQTPRRQPTAIRIEPHGPAKGDKEVLIETGKQLVGGLRDGLLTFFEDIRQATVGEEASSSPEQNSRPTRASYNARPQGHQRLERNANRLSHSKILDQAHGRKMPGMTPVTPSKQQTSRLYAHINTERVQANKISLEAFNEPTNSIDEDPWDTWDSPSTIKLASERKESVTSESVGSPSLSTERNSPRSSMSSLDTTPTIAQTDPTIQKQNEIPWPALTKLSPGNLRMTASTLMNEWEKSLGQPGRVDNRVGTLADTLAKDCKED
ncbi:MAG: hypothetical protein LQ350_001717 [Teloschistes chrysophthalmus]|nr:MAG: hypothetical protein LQ350_001717 [Niorma chrysophthalma]